MSCLDTSMGAVVHAKVSSITNDRTVILFCQGKDKWPLDQLATKLVQAKSGKN